MSALLAKLQLRSAQPAASPSSQDPSAIAIANDDPLGLLAHHSHAQQANLTSGPVAQPTYTTAVASRAASQVKKPAPFQNLGLHSGAASGNLGLVKFALDNGQPIDSVLNGVYPIHAACCSNANIAVVMYLIERGADVNARRLPRKYSSEKGVQTVGTTGSTPLHFAAANGCLAVVDILLRHGAIVDKADKYGSTPLSVAAARNHPDVASLLRQYSAMQRGVQDLTPDNEAKDPITDRRSSSDYGHRSPVTPPIRSPTRETMPPYPTDQQLTGRAVQTSRSPGQRRISMPSITESPSPADIPPMPRQSCDLGRTPQSTEPLVRSTGSIRSKPTRNVTLPLMIDDRAKVAPAPATAPLSGSQSQMVPPPPTRDLSDPTMNKSKGSHHPGRGMRRSHTTQGASQKSQHHSTAPAASSSAAHKVKRRKSMESAGFLSLQPGSAAAADGSAAPASVERRKSFDQLTDLTRSTKSRRSSDASTNSQGTASSGSSGTSHTSIDTAESGPRERPSRRGHSNGSGGSHSTRASTSATHATTAANTTRVSTDLNDVTVLSTSRSVDLTDHVPSQSPPLSRSLSQPTVEQIKPTRRKPLPFMDASVRQSLDLQRLISNQERTGHKGKNSANHLTMTSTTHTVYGGESSKNDSDSDLPGSYLRRRTMEIPTSSSSSGRPGTLPRYPSAVTVEALSRASMSEERPGRSQVRMHSSSSTTGSSTSLQEMVLPRHHSSGSVSSVHSASGSISGGTTNGSSSGMGSVTGRLSRMWSLSSTGSSTSNGSKETTTTTTTSVSGNWGAGEFGDASGEMVRPDNNRLRANANGNGNGVGVLNRLSGLWSRR